MRSATRRSAAVVLLVLALLPALASPGAQAAPGTSDRVTAASVPALACPPGLVCSDGPYTCTVTVAGATTGCTDTQTVHPGQSWYVTQDAPAASCRHSTGGSSSALVNPTMGAVLIYTNNTGSTVNFLHRVYCGPSFTGTVSGPYYVY